MEAFIKIDDAFGYEGGQIRIRHKTFPFHDPAGFSGRFVLGEIHNLYLGGGPAKSL
jgi:hypothetical protein